MNKIITISREFGSGGREIGKRLAEELKVNYYDREIITEIARETGLSEEYVANSSEKGIISYSYKFARTFSNYSNLQSNKTEILIATSKVLKEIAKKGDSVIVGRGANAILEEYGPMNIFVYADMETKVKRCHEKSSEDEKLTDKEIRNKINQIDKGRKNYHKIISNLEWGDKENYNLCINTSGIDIKNVIPSLAEYIRNWFKTNNLEI